MKEFERDGVTYYILPELHKGEANRCTLCDANTGPDNRCVNMPECTYSEVVFVRKEKLLDYITAKLTK